MNKWFLWRGRVFYFLLLTGTLTLIHGFMSGYERWVAPTPINDSAPTTFAAAPEIPPTSVIGNSNCRYGVAADPSQTPWISTVKAGWYINFGTGNSVIPGTEFVQFVTVHQNKNGSIYLPSFNITPALTEGQLGAVVDANRGNLWVVGNEIERVGQGDIFPDIYAIAYRDVYQFIKQRDPTAQVAIAALVQVTPSRLAYLDLVLQAYIRAFGHPMPVDVWTFHLYILPEVQTDGVTPNGIANVPLGVGVPPNPPFNNWRRESGGNAALCPLEEVYCFAEHTDMFTFRQQVTAMRQWLKARGYQNSPLLLTEFSVLYPYQVDPGGTCFIQDEYGNCFTPERVRTFMQETLAYLDGPDSINPNLGYAADGGRMVQQWLWYKMHAQGAGDVSNLLLENYATLPPGSSTALSHLGQTHRTVVSAIPLQVNLHPYQLSFTPINSHTVDIHIQVINNGNAEVTGNFTVAAYSDPNHTQLIGTANLSNVAGCARNNTTATIRWSNLTTGSHPFYVKVDAQNQIPETNEMDNFANSFVLVNPRKVYLPLTSR